MKIGVIFLLCFYSMQSIFAQDPVFTQFYAAPILINPSFAGSVGTSRIGVGYRDQWNGNNYKLSTSYVSIDSWFESINSGLGLSLTNQKEALTNYNFTQINLSYAYHLKLSKKLTFFPGISFGYGAKSYNFQNLILGDQINIFDGSIYPVSTDPFIENNKVKFLDISVGGVLYMKHAWLGISFKHLNKPNISFLEDENLPLPILFSLHGGYQFSLNSEDNSSFLPTDSFLFLTFNYMDQDVYNRLDLGAEAQLSSFYIGVLVSSQLMKIEPDADLLISVNPIIGLEINNFKLGLSYDFPISNIGNIGGTGEITMRYTLGKNQKKDRERLWQVKN